MHRTAAAQTVLTRVVVRWLAGRPVAARSEAHLRFAPGWRGACLAAFILAALGCGAAPESEDTTEVQTAAEETPAPDPVAVAACHDFVNAFVGTLSYCREACDDGEAECHLTWGDASANREQLDLQLRCDTSNGLSDRSGFQHICIPWIESRPCSTIQGGGMDPSCREQVQHSY